MLHRALPANDICILRDVCILALVMNGNAIDTERMQLHACCTLQTEHTTAWLCVKCCTCKVGLVSPPSEPCEALCVYLFQNFLLSKPALHELLTTLLPPSDCYLRAILGSPV